MKHSWKSEDMKKLFYLSSITHWNFILKNRAYYLLRWPLWWIKGEFLIMRHLDKSLFWLSFKIYLRDIWFLLLHPVEHWVTGCSYSSFQIDPKKQKEKVSGFLTKHGVTSTKARQEASSASRGRNQMDSTCWWKEWHVHTRRGGIVDSYLWETLYSRRQIKIPQLWICD